MALVGLAAGFVSVGAPGGQLSADPLAPARANAAALSHRVLQEAQLVHQRTVRYQVESARADLLRDELASSEASAQALRFRAGQTESLLRQEALLSYADALPAVGAGGQSSGDLMEATDRATYLALTVGDISGTLDLLQSEQSQLARTVATSRQQLQSALEAESSAAAARLLALREAGSLQVLLSRAESQVAALTSAERSPTGPPVGDGIVKALAQQLGATPANPRPTGSGASPARAATAAVKAPLVKAARAAAPSRKAALSSDARTRATTTAELAATTRTTTSGRQTTTTGRQTTTTGRQTTTTGLQTSTTGLQTTTTGLQTTTTGRQTTTSGGPPGTSTEARPATTTTATAPRAVGPATSTQPPSSTTTPSTTSSTSTTTTSTTTTTDPPAPTTTPAPTTPLPTTPPATTTATTADVHPPPAGGLWIELRECESGDNYQADTGNGYYGAYQFSWATWVDLGYPGRPDQEPYWMQDEAAQRLESMDGWGQWPSCSTALGV